MYLSLLLLLPRHDHLLMHSQDSLVTAVMVHILQMFYSGVITLKGKEGRLSMSDAFWDLRTMSCSVFCPALQGSGDNGGVEMNHLFIQLIWDELPPSGCYKLHSW